MLRVHTDPRVTLRMWDVAHGRALSFPRRRHDGIAGARRRRDDGVLAAGHVLRCTCMTLHVHDFAADARRQRDDDGLAAGHAEQVRLQRQVERRWVTAKQPTNQPTDQD